MTTQLEVLLKIKAVTPEIFLKSQRGYMSDFSNDDLCSFPALGLFSAVHCEDLQEQLRENSQIGRGPSKSAPEEIIFPVRPHPVPGYW